MSDTIATPMSKGESEYEPMVPVLSEQQHEQADSRTVDVAAITEPHEYRVQCQNIDTNDEGEDEDEARLQQLKKQLREQEDDHGKVEDTDEENWSEQEDDGKHPPHS